MLDMVEEKYERVNGEEVMLAAASIPHLRIQRNLLRIISNYLKGKRCEVFTEARTVFDNKNWYQPDILVVCDKNKIKGTHIEGAPDFIAEILSPTTQLRDMGIKKDTYEKYGVQEYWMISPKEETITVFLLRNGTYQIDNVYHNYTEEEWENLSEKERANQSMTLKISLYDDLELDVAEIFEK